VLTTMSATAPVSREYLRVPTRDPVHIGRPAAERAAFGEDRSDGCAGARGIVIGAVAGIGAWTVIGLTARAMWVLLAG